ncbi:FadR/GntR family transcriptional regulator [Sphingomonas sp. LB2R24]|uniref:FadR/GntR family transcriptional regulator n=1 Tax=Sphingomonas sorbitolis TaxID=3096165 RepID=UPI002FC7488F
MNETQDVPKHLSLFEPLGEKRISEEVADRIRRLIEEGSLRIGDRLPPERDLSKRLGVSRSVLREALRTLENKGLVRLKPGKGGGAFVAEFKTDTISESIGDLLRLARISLPQLTEARTWIEEVVVRVACDRGDETDFVALEENVALAEQLFAEGKMLEKLDVNIEFHNVLAAATKNPILVMMTKTLGGVMRSFAMRLGAETTRSVIRSRTTFIALLRQRNADGAVLEMREQLQAIEQVYVELAKTRGAYDLTIDNDLKRGEGAFSSLSNE